jgi:hypothetical protein
VCSKTVGPPVCRAHGAAARPSAYRVTPSQAAWPIASTRRRRRSGLACRADREVVKRCRRARKAKSRGPVPVRSRHRLDPPLPAGRRGMRPRRRPAGEIGQSAHTRGAFTIGAARKTPREASPRSCDPPSAQVRLPTICESARGTALTPIRPASAAVGHNFSQRCELFRRAGRDA